MTKTENIVSLPILSMEAMNLKVGNATKIFEPAMSYRFSATPSFELLSEARRQVLGYLNRTTSHNGIMSEGSDVAVDEILRASARLVEIVELFPSVFDAEQEAQMRTVDQKNGVGTGKKGEHLSSPSITPPKGALPLAG